MILNKKVINDKIKFINEYKNAINPAELNTIYHYPMEIRNIIYTTNTIESLNMSLRKITRNRRIFPSDESAAKIITLGILEASKKWTLPIKNWGKALGYLCLQHPEIGEF